MPEEYDIYAGRCEIKYNASHIEPDEEYNRWRLVEGRI